MKTTLWLLALAALVASEPWEEPWVEEEDLEEPYSEEREEQLRDAEPPQPRARRSAYDRQPYEEYIRVKRHCCDEPYRVRREADYVRVPRQVHQYEVHESSDGADFPSPPYEEMLAASAEHYHRVYAAPGAPAAARYLHPDVSAGPFGFRPVPAVTHFAPNSQRPLSFAEPPQKLVSVPPSHVHFAPPNHPVKHQQSPVNVAVNPAPEFVSHVSNTPSVVTQSPVQFVASNVGPVAIAVEPVGKVAGAAPTGPEPAPAVARLADGDLLSAAAGHQHHHHHHKGHGHSAGGGHSKHAGHHAAHGGKSIKGFNEHQHVDKGAKGHKTDEHHRKEYEEAAGKKKKHHDHAHHKGGHEEEAHGHRGAHFDEKKGHKKGHKTKGYHNKYHKDEFHKEHKFYDDFHKSGEHHRFGKFHAKHASNESGKKKAHHVNAGHDFVERGKKGYSNKGHMDADHKGYNGKHGHEEHHASHKNHGKKGGSEGGKEWGYEKKN